MEIAKSRRIIKIYKTLHVLIIIASLLLVVDISIDTFNNVPYKVEHFFLKFQLWICIFFLCELLFEFIVAKKKFEFLCTHFFFIIISIPYLNIINYFDISLPIEAQYFIRFIPLIRGGYALSIVVNWFSKNKASSLFVSYSSMLVASIYFSSLIFLVSEQKINPMVSSYGDALWWACMTVTTIGSNIYAMTTIGKVLSVVLAALGMMMFPIFTVYITSIVQKNNKKLKV